MFHSTSIEQSQGHSEQPVIPAKEREALLALYSATDGDHWKNRDGWLGPAGTECEWYGVSCAQRQASDPLGITGIELSENNLRGTVPEDLTKLAKLNSLSLFGDQIVGILPEPLIRRWLSGSLWIAEDHLLTDVSEIDFESSSSSALCARLRIVIRSDTDVTHFAERCRNATPANRSTFCEVKQGHTWPRQFSKLAWLMHDSGFYALQREYDAPVTDATFESTRVFRSEKKYEVVNYADAGPINL